MRDTTVPKMKSSPTSLVSLGGSFGYPVLPGSNLRTGPAGPLFCGTEYLLLSVPILKDRLPIINDSVQPVLGPNRLKNLRLDVESIERRKASRKCSRSASLQPFHKVTYKKTYLQPLFFLLMTPSYIVQSKLQLMNNLCSLTFLCQWSIANTCSMKIDKDKSKVMHLPHYTL